MKKIQLPFKWTFDLPPVAFFQFMLDYEKAGDAEDQTYDEYPSFIIDLSSGELLWVHKCISNGDAYEYETLSNWMIEGKGWWIKVGGYDENDSERFPDEKTAAEVKELFSPEGSYKAVFSKVVEMVCDAGRQNKTEFEKLSDYYKNPFKKVYAKHINNEECITLTGNPQIN